MNFNLTINLKVRGLKDQFNFIIVNLIPLDFIINLIKLKVKVNVNLNFQIIVKVKVILPFFI